MLGGEGVTVEPERHRAKRRNMMGESRLVSDWVALAYPGRWWHLQFRVGQDPDFGALGVVDEEERRQMRNFNRRAGAGAGGGIRRRRTSASGRPTAAVGVRLAPLRREMRSGPTSGGEHPIEM